MDATFMSLDEIIQKKRIYSTGFRRNGNTRQQHQQQQHQQRPIVKRTNNFQDNRIKKPIVDARNTIIARNRSKIRDARDKLVQITRRGGDARLRLMKKVQQQRVPINPVKMTKKRRPSYYVERPAYVHNDDLMEVEEEYMPVLRRTVKNEIALSNMSNISMMPALPTYSRTEPIRHDSPVMWNSDPFDCYEVPVGRPADVSEPKHLHRQIRNIGTESMPRKGILRNAREKSPTPVFTPDENSHLSYEMRNRLERPPDSSASMGIFSNPYTTKSSARSSDGYRIVVSNLHNTVSQSDIKELFEDIGQLMEARLVRPGIAEVIFETMKDAETAVETYHNRQLDGQPMKCLLVNPRSLNKTSSAAVLPSAQRSSRTTNPTKSSLEIDIDALHKVLFRRK